MVDRESNHRESNSIHGSSEDNADIVSCLLKELDQVTPLATSQLQAFCSIVVAQMKHYPAVFEGLSKNIQNLTEAVQKLDKRISEIENTENKHFEVTNSEQNKTNQRFIDLEQNLSIISAWRKEHEAEIRQNKHSTLKQIEELQKSTDLLDQTLEIQQRESTTRMDCIEKAADTNVEIRDSINEHMELLKTDFEIHNDEFSNKNLNLSSRLEDQEATIVLLKEEIKKLEGLLQQTKDGVKELDVRQQPLEGSLSYLRKDIAVLERGVTETENRVVDLESSKETVEETINNQDRRLTDLERDNRVSELETLYPRVSSLERSTKEQDETNAEANLLFNKKIESLTNQLEVFGPKLLELGSEFDTVKDDVKFTKESNTELCSEIDVAQNQLHILFEHTEELRHRLETTQDQIFRAEGDQTTRNQKLWDFIEEALKAVPRYYDLEDINRTLNDMKLELQKEIEDSKHTVKFELLHDPSPQVDLLKDYMKQQDEGQTNLKQKVQLMEQTIKSQHQTIHRADERIQDSLQSFPSGDTIREIEDIPRMKQRIQQMNEALQILQEQLIQIKRQFNGAAEAASYSRCSSLRSSVALNPSAMNFLKKQSMKTLRKTCFLEPEASMNASMKMSSTPPRTSDSTISHNQDEKTATSQSTATSVHDFGTNAALVSN